MTHPTPRVRPAADADAPAVRALQSLLPEPAPRLLAVGLAAGDVLVSTLPTGNAGDASRRGRAAPVRSAGRSAPSETPGGVPVGYLLPVGGGGDGAGDTRDGGDADGDSAVHVAELAVAPDRRREGRASELLRALCGALPPDARVTIAVEPSNRAARACYESLGFEETARREAHFESGPAVVYERLAGGSSDGGVSDRDA